jgi:hypothetical protein
VPPLSPPARCPPPPRGRPWAADSRSALRFGRTGALTYSEEPELEGVVEDGAVQPPPEDEPPLEAEPAVDPLLPDELGLLGDERSTAEPVPLLRSGPLDRLSGSARSALPRCAQAGVELSAKAVTPTATSNLPRVMTTLLGLKLATILPQAEPQHR